MLNLLLYLLYSLLPLLLRYKHFSERECSISVKTVFNICMSRFFHIFITISTAHLTFFFPLKKMATKKWNMKLTLYVNLPYFPKHISLCDYKEGGLFFGDNFYCCFIFSGGSVLENIMCSNLSKNTNFLWSTSVQCLLHKWFYLVSIELWIVE